LTSRPQSQQTNSSGWFSWPLNFDRTHRTPTAYLTVSSRQEKTGISFLTSTRRFVYTPLMTSEELKRRRVALGLSQVELAALLHVDSMTVSRWERGQHRIPEAVALAVHHLKAKRK